LLPVSRKWRKSRKSSAAVPAVPYGPPVTQAVLPASASHDTLKSVGKAAVTIAAPFVLGAIFKALAKR
jgi:hypothetical protein